MLSKTSGNNIVSLSFSYNPSSVSISNKEMKSTGFDSQTPRNTAEKANRQKQLNDLAIWMIGGYTTFMMGIISLVGGRSNADGNNAKYFSRKKRRVVIFAIV